MIRSGITPKRKMQIGCSLVLVVLLLAGMAWVVAASEARTGKRYLSQMAFAPDGRYAFVAGDEAGSIGVFSFGENRQIDAH